MNFLKHLFFPRFSNNQRARLIHSQIIFLFVLFLVGGSFVLSTARKHFEGVLGVSVNVISSDLLTLTNQRRADAGLSPLQYNQQLAQAAEAKAQDMFAKDYWAHFAPDGKSPWDFIRASGYDYLYAGENLARGFTSSTDVVNAWMASPDHRANLLSGNYTDVGFAIEQGRLPGDDSTVLVVQMFGSRTIAKAPVVPPVVTSVPTVEPTLVPVAGSGSGQLANHPSLTPIQSRPTPPPVLSAVKNKPVFDSAFGTKVISYALLSLFVILFGLDVVFTESRKTVRLTGHSFDHLLFLIGILIIALGLGFGVVI